MIQLKYILLSKVQMVPWYPLVLKTSARLCNAFPIFWYSLGSAERGKRMGKRGKQKKKPTRVIETRSAVFPKLDRSRSKKQLGFTFPLVKHLQSHSYPLPCYTHSKMG